MKCGRIVYAGKSAHATLLIRWAGFGDGALLTPSTDCKNRPFFFLILHRNNSNFSSNKNTFNDSTTHQRGVSKVCSEICRRGFFFHRKTSQAHYFWWFCPKRIQEFIKLILKKMYFKIQKWEKNLLKIAFFGANTGLTTFFFHSSASNPIFSKHFLSHEADSFTPQQQFWFNTGRNQKQWAFLLRLGTCIRDPTNSKRVL